MKKISRLMLLSNFVCDLFYSLSYPYIYAETVKVVSKNYISAEQIIACLGTVIFGVVWNRFGDKLFRNYKKIIALETIFDISLIAHVLITHNLKRYFIFNVLIYSIVTRCMSNGGIRLRAKVHPDEHSRECYEEEFNSV